MLANPGSEKHRRKLLLTFGVRVCGETVNEGSLGLEVSCYGGHYRSRMPSRSSEKKRDIAEADDASPAHHTCERREQTMVAIMPVICFLKVGCPFACEILTSRTIRARLHCFGWTDSLSSSSVKSRSTISPSYRHLEIAPA